MKSLLLAGVCVMLGFWLTPPAAAHHSMTGFDKKSTVKLEGVVKTFSWQNPHCYIEIEVLGKDGKPVIWNVEMTAPGYLIRAGWKKTAIKAGDKVTVLANPLLTGEPGALFVSVTLPDGQTLSQRGVEPAAK
jgi:hypothetical protein